MTSLPPEKEPLESQLINESHAMVEYALKSGIKVPSVLVQSLEKIISGDEKSDIKALTDIYNHLTEIIAPTIPRTVMMLNEEENKKSFWKFLGPIPLVRQLTMATIVCIIALIVVSLSDMVNTTSINKSLFASNGLSLLLNLVFILAAAGIGGGFSSLYRVNGYLIAGTFDPRFSSTYWTRFLLGLIAGLIISELIPVNFNFSDIEGGQSGQDEAATQAFIKPSLAIFGGFSATFVYNVLERMIQALGSLLKGDVRTVVSAEKKKIENELNTKMSTSRMRLASKLMDIQGNLSDKKPEEIKSDLNHILDELMPSGRTTDQDR
ncbi:MAG: hypothetical protein AAFX87_17735 [Bacteroidota bacterium]